MRKRIGVVFGAGCSVAVGLTRCSAQDWSKEGVMGAYENRLRRHSAPEKVFEYFASAKHPETGDPRMSPRDFLRAVSPFSSNSAGAGRTVGSTNPKWQFSSWKDDVDGLEEGEVEKRVKLAREGDETSKVLLLRWMDAGLLGHDLISGEFEMQLIAWGKEQGEELGVIASKIEERNKFRNLVDADGDGLVDFGEFLLFVSLLQLGEEQLVHAFRAVDFDESGEIDQLEFAAMVALLRRQTPQGRQALGGDWERDMRPPKAMEDPVSGAVSMQSFLKYAAQLRRAVREVEFRAMDISGDGKLDRSEFENYLLASVRESEAEQMRSRRSHADASVHSTTEGYDEDAMTMEDFLAFHHLISNLTDMSESLKVLSYTQGTSTQAISRDTFNKATTIAIGRPLHIVATDVLFGLLDADGDGHLSLQEFQELVQLRGGRSLSKERGLQTIPGIPKLVRCIRQLVER